MCHTHCLCVSSVNRPHDWFACTLNDHCDLFDGSLAFEARRSGDCVPVMVVVGGVGGWGCDENASPYHLCEWPV